MQSTSTNTARLLPVYTGIFTGVLILSNILASKMIQLGPFVFDGGTLLFPVSYIFGDVLAEVYGFRQSRKVIWTGFGMLLFMVANIWIISLLPAESSWPLQSAFDSILLQMPRLAAASIIGYFAGEYINAVVLSKMKVLQKGHFLWMRTIGSTLAGELLDSVIFVFIGFYGLYETSILWVMIFSNYLFKIAIEVIFTPCTYYIIRKTKQVEQLDVFDYGERYNPLPGK